MASRIERASSGAGMNYEGLDTTHMTFDGEVIFRNDYEGGRLSDDDISVAELLTRTGQWIRGDGAAPYPLADACQDHTLSMAIDLAAATGEVVRTEREPWHG
jgi:hypothetical protein